MSNGLSSRTRMDRRAFIRLFGAGVGGAFIAGLVPLSLGPFATLPAVQALQPAGDNQSLALLISQWQNGFAQTQFYVRLFEASSYTHAIINHPEWTQDQLAGYLVDMDGRIQKGLAGGQASTYKTVEELLVSAVGVIPSIGVGNSGASWDPQHLAQFLSKVVDQFAYPSYVRSDQVNSVQTQGQIVQAFSGYETDMIADVQAGLMSASPDQVQIFNGFFGPIQIPTTSSGTADLSPNDLIDLLPGIPPQIVDTVTPQSDGSVTVNVDLAHRIAEDSMNEMSAAIGNLLVAAQPLNGLLPSGSASAMLTPPNDQVVKARSIASASTAEYYRAVAAAGAPWLNVIGTLIGFSDPKLGNEVKTIGSAGLQIGDAAVKLIQAIPNIDGAISGLASAALTGNIVGAALSIVSVFASSGPSPDEMILEQIGQLRQQIGEMQQQMQQRFDQIDQQLNTIFTVVTAQLNKIVVTTGEILDAVDNIQQTLSNTLAAVYRTQADMDKYFVEGERNQLQNMINLAIGYEQTYGQPMDYATYILAENTFYTWAVNVSTDSAEAPIDLAMDDGSVAATLASLSLDTLPNYVNRLLRLRGLPMLGDGSVLANPRTYAMAARALALLQWQNPDFAARVDPQRTLDVRAIGQHYLDNCASFALAGPSIVEGVTARYIAAAKAFHDLTEGDRQTFIKQTAPGNLDWPSNVAVSVDFWAVDPTTSDFGATPVVCISPIDGLTPPNNLRYLVPLPILNYEWTQGYLSDSSPIQAHQDNAPVRDSPLQFKLETSYTDVRGRSPKPGLPLVWTGILNITLTAVYAGTDGTDTLWRRTVTGPRLGVSGPSPRPKSGAPANYWDSGIRAQFEARITGDALTPDETSHLAALVKSLSVAVVARFGACRAFFAHDLVRNKLPNSPYSDALSALSAESQLLQATVQLGLPRATMFDDSLRTLAVGGGHYPTGADVSGWWQAAQDGRAELPAAVFYRQYGPLNQVLTSRIRWFVDLQKTGGYVDDDPLVRATVGVLDASSNFVQLSAAWSASPEPSPPTDTPTPAST